MPNMTVEQARENLFQTASTLTIDQIPTIFAALKKVLDEMSGDFLWPAVRTAHQAKGIKAETFARDLFVSDGLKKPIHRRTEKWDVLADPYSQLDFKVWCEYLMFGKERVLDKKANPVRKAKDQDAFFDFIHIHVYFLLRTPNGTDKELEHKEFTAFAECLKKVHTVRNLIEHENYVDASLATLAGAVFAMSDVLSKMNYTGWKVKQNQWQKRLIRTYFDAIGVIDYSVEAVMAYMDAVGCNVSAQQQAALEQLLKDAGMDVANGKMSFSGNIIDFIAGVLAEAWSLAQTDPTAGAEKVKKALKGPLPPYALLSAEQKLRAVGFLEQYSPKLKEPLVEVVRAAHNSGGIAEKTFEDNLYITEGTGGKPLLDETYRWKADADPYKRLDLHGWLKYLRFGGCRRDANGDPVKDQDAVFAFLNIPYDYTTDAVRKLDCEFANHLVRLNDARNDITSHWAPATVEQTTTEEIMQWYESLLAVLEPMSRKDWQGKADCQKLMDDIKDGFKVAVGGLTYSIADILNYLKPLEYTQTEVEARLVELGYPVSNGGVTIEEDIESFITTLPVAIELMQDMRRLPENPEADEKLTKWIMDRARASEERAVRWFEKRAYGPNPNPAALYYLGSCGLYGRGTAIDRFEAMAMIHSAARKGYPLAQVRMGIYCEDWPRQLRKPREDDAIAWYQKAADQECPDGQYHLGQHYGSGSNSDRAYHYYWAAEQQGHMPAKLARGKLYMEGYRMGRDAKKAEQLYLELVEKEYVPAMKELAWLYTNSLTHPELTNLEKAKELFLKAAYHGDGDASAFKELAKAYMWGAFQDKNDGWISQDQKKERRAADQKESVRWLTMAAKNGDVEAMYWLGSCCQSGVGAEKNEQAAFYWFQKAAEQGDSGAKWELANCYAAGIGVRENMDTAKKLYGEARDSHAAQRMFSVLLDKQSISRHLTGLVGFPETSRMLCCQRSLWELMWVVKQNEEVASHESEYINYGEALFQYELAELYEMAFALQASTTPENEAAVQQQILENPKGIFCNIPEEYAQSYAYVRVQEEDLKKAFALYEKAANTGLKKAMRALGRCYEQGIGVDKDVYQAIAWYKKAARGEDTEAMVALADCYLQNAEALSKTMDADEAKEKAIKAYRFAYRRGAKGVWQKLKDLGVEVGW